EILKKLDSGRSVKFLSQEYGIVTLMIYNLKKQKSLLLKFYANSDTPNLMENRKTLHQPRNTDVDEVLMEWIRQQHSEKVQLDRSLIMAQAKLFHEPLGIQTACKYSSGWFTKFKKRHGLRILSICSDKVSADHESGEAFVKEFTELFLTTIYLQNRFTMLMKQHCSGDMFLVKLMLRQMNWRRVESKIQKNV
ncbi:Jerky, partial [Araneus ventricosus]